MSRPAPDEKTGDVRPAPAGAKALGSMELAARRAREARTARVAATYDPDSPPGPEQPTAWIDPHGLNEELGRRRTSSTVPPERWLAVAVGVASLLVVIAAIALAISLSSSSTPVATPPPPLGAAHAGGTASQPGTHPSPASAAPAAPQTTSTLPSLATPSGAPVITSLNPSSGGSGQTIQVTGSNFLSSDGQIVATFGGQVASTICPSQTTCTVTVPSASPTSGSVAVVITTSAGTSNTVTFRYS
jgi:IPT/TIG domain